MKHKIEQLKWMYGAFTGVCVTFFLALLSSNQPLYESPSLLLSSFIFAALLPVFSCFTLAHVYLIEEQTAPEKAQAALDSDRVQSLTRYALYAFFVAFVLLVSHFSLWAGGFMLVSSWAIRNELKRFVLAVSSET